MVDVCLVFRVALPVLEPPTSPVAVARNSIGCRAVLAGQTVTHHARHALVQ